MECYGPAYSEELTAEIYDKSFEERKRYITDYLQKTQLIGKLEEELKKTKRMALTEAELITPGSGYGAFRKEYARTGHLKFVKKTESMEKWEHFFEYRRASLSGPRDRTGCILEWRRISRLI